MKYLRGFTALIGVMTFLFLFLVQCSKIKSDSEEGKAESERKRLETEQKILELASQYGADADWKNKLGMDTSTSLEKAVYTLQLQRAIMKGSRQPIIVVAGLRDVTKKANNYYAIFEKNDYESSLSFPSITFILSCDSTAAEALIRQPVEPLFSDQFAIIASIEDVRTRHRLDPKAHPIDEYDAEIDWEPTTAFSAVGKLADFLFVADYESPNRF